MIGRPCHQCYYQDISWWPSTTNIVTEKEPESREGGERGGVSYLDTSFYKFNGFSFTEAGYITSLEYHGSADVLIVFCCCWETWMKIKFFEKSEWKSQNEKTFFQFSVLRQEQVYLSTNLVFLERNRKWLSEKKWSWFLQEFTRTRIPATLCGSVHPFSNSVWR